MAFARFRTACANSAAALGAAAWRIVAACCVAALSFAAIADDDLPGRVGRVADAAGGLFLSPESQATEWTEIGVNYPITSGDSLWASEGGRAEVEYGGGQFRLAGATNLHVSRLDDRQLALFVAQGQLIVRIRVLDPGEAVRVDAPTAQVQLTRIGLYRIVVLPERQTIVVTVREGEALVALPSGVWQALPGQAVAVTGQDPAAAEMRRADGVDGFDTWSADRDRTYERGRSSAYVSGEMVGAAELDEYGVWQTTPDYGAVWFPNAVPADWAPYRDGYWTTVGAWGATWVDAAPWGYAPSHYGRWAWIGGRWGWCPGTYVRRPVWAPALVAWHGGAGWAVSVGFGAPVYGWVPLGWREPYLPPWRGCSARCWTRYNQPYAVDVRERPHRPPASYVNMAVPGAVTAVSGATLTGARPVAANRVRLPAQTVGAAPVLAGAPPVVPVRTRTPAGSAGSLPQPAALLHPQRSRTVDSAARAGTAASSGEAALKGGPAGPTGVDAGTGRVSPRPSAPYRATVPPAPTSAAAGRAVEAPAVRPGSPYPQQRPAPSPVPPATSGAAIQAAPQQAYGATTQPVRPALPQRVERSVAPPLTPVAPQQRVERSVVAPVAPVAPQQRGGGVAAPVAPMVPMAPQQRAGGAVAPAAGHPAAPATVAAPAPQAPAPGGATPQSNLVRPAGRGPQEVAPVK